MKLIVAIVSEEKARRILDTLSQAHYRATLISTTGGFLRKGNCTLLIGVEADQVDGVLTILANARAAKTPHSNAKDSSATIFVLNVARAEQM